MPTKLYDSKCKWKLINGRLTSRWKHTEAIVYLLNYSRRIFIVDGTVCNTHLVPRGKELPTRDTQQTQIFSLFFLSSTKCRAHNQTSCDLDTNTVARHCSQPLDENSLCQAACKAPQILSNPRENNSHTTRPNKSMFWETRVFLLTNSKSFITYKTFVLFEMARSCCEQLFRTAPGTTKLFVYPSRAILS